MPGDRTPVSPTELAQLRRCEQQLLFDERYGARRSRRWQARSAEGRAVHARMHRDATRRTQRKGRPMLIITIIILLLALLASLLLPGARGESTDRLLPPELKGAELWLSEKALARRKPVHVRGRPDEVWVKNGRRFLVETKSRAGGVFDGDRMQLAAYAYLLRGEDGPPLAPHGYIRFTGGDEVSFARVRLMDDEAVVEAHRRLDGLRRKKAEPGFASHAALCEGCGHRERCPGARVG